MNLIQKSIGLRDRDTSEYLIHQVRECQTLEQFQASLEKDQAQFSLDLIHSLYHLVKNYPKVKSRLKREDDDDEEEAVGEDYNKFVKSKHQESFNSNDDGGDDKSEDEKGQEDLEKRNVQELKTKFPSLALPNTNKEIMDIDFSDDGEEEKEKQEKEALKSVKETKRKSKEQHREEEDKYDKQKYHSRRKQTQRDSKREDRSHSSRYKQRKRSRSRQRQKLELKIGQLHLARVQSVKQFGCFMKLLDFPRARDGLLHISQLRNMPHLASFYRSESFPQIHRMVKVGDEFTVKVYDIKDEKITLSGHLSEKRQERSRNNLKRSKIPPIEPITTPDGQKIGSITGVNLSSGKESLKLKRLRSPDMWEYTRLKAGNMLNSANQLLKEMHGGNLTSDKVEELEEDGADIEIMEEPAPFMKHTRVRSHISPPKVTKNPDGSLSRAIIKQSQIAKQRVRPKNPDEKGSGNQLQGSFKQQNDNLDKQNISEWKRNNFNQFIQMKSQNSQKISNIDAQRRKLPIYNLKQKLMEAINQNHILVVIGQTGSGKTTQITQYLLEMGFSHHNTKMIGCTQPRRVAAMSVAKRVAQEMSVKVGQEVGYCIRFEDRTSSKTLIKYMTEGMMLREALIDPLLNQYSVIMLDQAHERTVQTDVLFGLMKTAITKRNDLKLIVTSATLDAEKFSSYFCDCPIFRIPGRTFPVEILQSKEPQSDYLDASLQAVMQIHLGEPRGDILLFLTGQEQIDNACQILFNRMKQMANDAPQLIILPVYSALPSDLQAKIFEQAPKGSRKCIVATNIAQASLTIDGIFYVVDPGFAKIKCFNPKLGMDSLVVAPISQASAKQRAGRAGRTGPGKCFRLYTSEAYKYEMIATSVPQIQRTNLANTVLLLKAMGINDLINFDFMDPPPVPTLINAMQTLYALGALDDDGLLQKLGKLMAEFPLQPQLAKMLLTSIDLGCSDQIITIVAMLSIQSVFYRPRDKAKLADQKKARFHHAEGDHLTMLGIYEQWKNHQYSSEWCHQNFIQMRGLQRAKDVRKQILMILDRFKLPIVSCRIGQHNHAQNSSQSEEWKIRKAVAAGFFTHAARRSRQDGYRTLVDNQTVYIHPGSAVFNKNPEWVVYHELVLTNKEYIREVSTIDPKWLVDVAPKFFKHAEGVKLSKKKREEKLKPLFNRFEDQDSWRLSNRKG